MAAAAAKKPLRVVKADEKAPKVRKKMTVAQAIESGDELDRKLAERRIIATRLDNEKTPARDIAALTKRMSEVCAEIAALEAAEASTKEEDADSDDAGDEAFDASAI